MLQLMRTSAVLALTTIALYAQSTSFEVASLKRVDPGEIERLAAAERSGQDISMRVGWWGGPGTNDPELFTAGNVSLSRLITRAYDLNANQLTAPEWAGIERYNLRAKLRLGVTEEQFRLMLQNLLAERVRLQVHWETKETPSFDLVVAKAGPKFKEAASTPSPAARFPEGYPDLPPGEETTGITQRGRAVFRAHGEAMERIADLLSAYLRFPVKDATGLRGKYDFALYWVQNPNVLPPEADTGPTLSEALQEQLGLKLETSRGSIRILVIDHAEKIPTDN
jgi:uncharacterized protein (TIGR03435 family)